MEEIAIGDARQELQVARFVLDLHSRNHTKCTRHLGKALLLGNGGEGRIENIPLLALALGRGKQILLGSADAPSWICRLVNLRLATLEQLEENLGVLLFLRRGLVEYGICS